MWFMFELVTHRDLVKTFHFGTLREDINLHLIFNPCLIKLFILGLQSIQLSIPFEWMLPHLIGEGLKNLKIMWRFPLGGGRGGGSAGVIFHFIFFYFLDVIASLGLGYGSE